MRISSKPLMDIFDIRRLRHASTKENKIHSAPRRAFGKKKTESSRFHRKLNILEKSCEASRTHLTHVDIEQQRHQFSKGSIREEQQEGGLGSLDRTYVRLMSCQKQTGGDFSGRKNNGSESRHHRVRRVRRGGSEGLSVKKFFGLVIDDCRKGNEFFSRRLWVMKWTMTKDELILHASRSEWCLL